MQIQKVHLKNRTKDLTGRLTSPDFAHSRDFLEVTVYPSRLIHIDFQWKLRCQETWRWGEWHGLCLYPG